MICDGVVKDKDENLIESFKFGKQKMWTKQTRRYFSKKDGQEFKEVLSWARHSLKVLKSGIF